MRDPDFVATLVATSPPMFTPFRLRALELANRVVVSPMDMYSLASTARRATSTSCTSARARSAAPGW